MNEREQELLNLVIETYIKTAEPVGSRFLVENAGLNWSEATVRNELRALEEDGYLTHPHTSAGRVPTTKGYEHYLRQLNQKQEVVPSRKEVNQLEEAYRAYGDFEHAMRNVAKKLCEVSDEAVLIAFSPDRVYYTGLSNLFEKPDFEEMKQIASISNAFDRADELLPDLFRRIPDQPEVLLGDEHPFGSMLSVVASRFGEEDKKSLILLLGPQRMDYKRNLGLINKLIELL